MKGIKLHRIALGDSNYITTDGKNVRTLWKILELNGHLDNHIDFLKIDIEGDEWDSLHAAFIQNALKNVKQLALEVHTDELVPSFEAASGRTSGKPTSPGRYKKFVKVMEALERAHFFKWRSQPNPTSSFRSPNTSKKRTCCYDLNYINLNFINMQS